MVRYDASRQALYAPGGATDFFQLGPTGGEAPLCAEMARLAYVTEPDRLRAFLQRGGLVLVRMFDAAGTQGLVADRSGLRVIAFRGTEGAEPSDLFADARFAKTAWSVEGTPRGAVHAGFAGALDPIWTAVAGATGSGPARLLLTGHSLGGALATLAASRLPHARLYTFGSPRVGDPAFAQSVGPERHDRYVNCCDVVARVPPTFAGYEHTGTLRYIDRMGTIASPPTEDDPAVEADRRIASREYVERLGLLKGTVAVRELADHAPVNYVSALLGVRA
jgi:hypothetical protein